MKHSAGSHDDLFWAFRIGVYGVKKLMDERSNSIFVSSNLDGEPISATMLHDVDLFPELDKLGATITDVAKHIPS
ncbi:MAG: hypothetical protein ACRD38_12745 [Nitrososphaerales archaeon]